ncbi:helix-turn-helix domain-containing protein [Paraburkholderia kururiensis]|uniref:helix-turn-helix domain-containing protein n=1 Tax=Paraburkholderia kururiensis TaxID=984307 RepID=UPI000685BD84|nr:helix-turn-helix domain-containing protein [Paraburkholderia kururiensis]
MSLNAITWARHQKVGKGPAKSILMALADYASEDFEAHPSIETMQGWSEQNRKTVISNLKYLQDKGFIVDTGRRVGKTGSIPVYRLKNPTGKRVEVGPPDELSTSDTKSGTSKQSQKRNGTENGTVPNSTGSSTVSDSKQYRKRPGSSTENGTQNYQLTVIEQKEQCADQKTVGAPTSKFERFWQMWPQSPRKVDKADCRKHWERHNLDVKAEVIIAHLQAMKLTKQWKDGFEPAPETYLNGKRWEDGLPPTEEQLAARAEDAEWWLDASATERKGAEMGVRARNAEEPVPYYRVFVAKACGRGPWIDYVLKHAEKSGSPKFYEWVRTQLGDALLPPDDYAS